MWLIQGRMFFAVFVLLLDPSRYIFAVGIDKQVCGFEQTCEGNRTDIEQKNDSCCQPCECADVCRERDTCCADKERLSDIKESIKQECLHAVYTPRGLREPDDIQSYYTRTRCPETFNNLDLKEKCESKIPESLDDITFVTSEDGTIIYKNKHCGLCHGEKRTVPWKLIVSADCIDMQTIEESALTATVVQHLLKDCPVTMRPPANLAYKQTLCYENAVNQCNKTGDWEVYERRLEELCHRPPAPAVHNTMNAESVYYYTMSPAYAVYRNMYCYLCNSKTKTFANNCQLLDTRFSAQNAFSILIKHSALTSSEDNERKSKRCTAYQILDTFFNICRQLYCPWFFISNHGQCIHFLEVKLAYPLVLRLVPLEPVNRTESVKQGIVSQYHKVLMKLGFGVCKLSRTVIYLKKDNQETLLPDVYLKFALAVTKRCVLEYLISKLNSIETKASVNINIPVNKMFVRFAVSWDNKTTWRTDQFERFFYERYENYPVRSLSRASNCPKVKLTTTEFQTVQKNHVSANELVYAPVKDDENGTMFVCCDRYIVKPRSECVGKRLNVATALLTSIIAISRPTF